MRILRGKSNLEVTSQGFAWFVVGLVLATFIGGAIRTILTSDRVHQRIVTELRNRFPQHEFQIGPTEVLLSSGLWPGLGLKVRNLVFRQDVCGKLSFVLEVPEAILPVDLFSLRNGKVRLGRVELSNGKLQLNYKPCAEDVVAESNAKGLETALKKPTLEAPSLNWKKVGEHMDAIELRAFTVTYPRNVTWKLLIHSMRLDLDDELEARGLLEVQKSLPFGALSHIVEFDAEGDDQILQWGLRSEFKEGHINLKGTLDLSNQRAVLQANARQLPLRDVMSELHQMGFVSRDMQLKTTWLSCSAKWEGILNKPFATPLQANGCKLEGGYGRVDLEQAEIWLDRPSELKSPAVLKVSKLQMQPVLEALGRQVLPRVLPRPGVWTGELKYLNPDSWSLDGHLENVEVAFSNQSVRGKQSLERLRTQVERGAERIEAKISDLTIRGGAFVGALQFSLASDWRNGDFKADIAKLRFGPSVQTLLTGGQLGDLKLTGQGTLLGGELGKWEGDFDLAEVSGVGWSAKGLRGKSRYSPGVFHLEGKAIEANITPAWRAYPQVQVILPEAKGDVAWSELNAKVDILASGGTIHSITGAENESQQSWRVKGSWVRDGEFNALLNLGQLGSRGRTFALRGEKGQLNVQEPLR